MEIYRKLQLKDICINSNLFIYFFRIAIKMYYVV